MPILDKNEINKLFSFKSMENMIPYSAMSSIYEKLRTMENSPKEVEKYTEYSLHYSAIVIKEYIGAWRDSANPWMTWTTGKYEFRDTEFSGNWTTRFSKLFKRLTGQAINDKLLEFLGTELGNSKKSINQFFAIQKAFDWNPGDFAERDNKSCWWNDYRGSRMGMIGNSYGYVVTVFESEEEYKKHNGSKGIGRAWMILEEERAVIFNAYGAPLSELAVGISETFGLQHKKVTITSKEAYINTGNHNNETRGGGSEGLGYVIAKDVSSIEASIRVVDFAIDKIKCHKCSNKYYPKEMTVKNKTELYCQDCIELMFPKCRSCGKYELGKIVFYSGGRTNFCNECFERHNLGAEHHQCTEHGTTYSTTYKVWHTNIRACDTCISQGRYEHCQGCSRLLPSSQVKIELSLPNKRRLGYKICKGCARSLISQLKEETR